MMLRVGSNSSRGRAVEKNRQRYLEAAAVRPHLLQEAFLEGGSPAAVRVDSLQEASQSDALQGEGPPTMLESLLNFCRLRPLLLLGLLLVTGCSRPIATHYLALGDSYTIGQSIPESDRWPAQLVATLKARGIDLGTPQIIAQTGWTTADLLSAINDADLQSHYEWVTLMIGVNDEFQHLPIEDFRSRLDQLLDRSIALAGDANHVVVISIPDWGVTPFAGGGDVAAIARDIDRFNAVYAEEAGRKHAAFVDVTAISRTAAADRSLIADDGLHPSGKMYAQWVIAIMQLMKLN